MTPFKLPISYISEKRSFSSNLITDLELVSNKKNSLYESVLLPQNELGKNTINLWANEYTWDKSYLKDTQNLLKTDLPKPIKDCSEAIGKRC